MTLIGETLVQFGGKIGAHNLQKFGAEFRSALGKLSHVLQIPFGKPCRPPRHDVRWTDESAVRTRIPDELPGSEHYRRLATDNRFSFAGNKDNRVRNPVTPFDDYLARREVDPVGKAHHLQKFSLVNGAKCYAVQFRLFVAKDYWAPFEDEGHDPNPVDEDECQSPENRRPERSVLEIVVRQHDDIGSERQNAQLEDTSHRDGQQKRKIREVDQTVQSEDLIGQEVSQ